MVLLTGKIVPVFLSIKRYNKKSTFARKHLPEKHLSKQHISMEKCVP